MHTGAVVCDLLASTCCTVHSQVDGSLGPCLFVMYSISGCVVGELKCPLLTVITPGYSPLILEKGSSPCNQLYGFCYQLGFLKAFLFLNTTGNCCPVVKKNSKVNSCPKSFPEVHVQVDWFSIVMDSSGPKKLQGSLDHKRNGQKVSSLCQCAIQSCSLTRKLLNSLVISTPDFLLCQ